MYGIFLGEYARQSYGMIYPTYDTVKNFITVGNHIVKARFVEDDTVALTGLLVYISPTEWQELDLLEAGYERTKIVTTNGVEAYMYADRGTDDKRQDYNQRRQTTENE